MKGRKHKLYNIAVLPGDGVGPEVIREGLKVLEAAAKAYDIRYDLIHYDLGGERYLATGEVLPDSVLEELKKVDAIYLGAVGHPKVKPGILEKELLLRLRFELDQYINLRPVKLYPGVETPLKDKGPEHIDFIVVRENTECLYSGAGGFLRKGSPYEVAIQEMIYTRQGTERCIRYAFELTRKRGKKHTLTLCDKSNVLTYGHDLWQRVFAEVGEEYPDIKRDHAYIDACCMWMVKNPEWFDVIVTCNMFGDIITDLGAIVQGGMGIAAGGNINPEGVSMFEPIHGSAPKYTDKNEINPLATISAGQMMLEHLGEDKAADLIEQAIIRLLSEGCIKDMAAGKMGLSTSEVGDLLVRFIEGKYSGR
ncbi:MAG: 3-isopropylmalate dehydrogenase [bacterium]